EVKNIIEQTPKRRIRIIESLQNFRIIQKKSSISLNNTSQISSVIANTPDLLTKEPEYSLSMGDEHLSTILEIESKKVIKSSVENLVPIPSLIIFSRSSLVLAHIDPILPGIEEADFDLVEEIQEIDLFLATDDLMPPGIEKDDYDLEGDIHFLEELLSTDPLSFLDNESFNFNHHNDSSFPRPPPEPSDVFFDFEHDTRVLTAKVVEDISEYYVLMPKFLPS
nr:hypothetical protein [Tanacetum cinerariifolium]